MCQCDGCTEMQGYLFSPPRPAGEVARLLAAADSWPGATDAASKPAGTKETPLDPSRQLVRAASA